MEKNLIPFPVDTRRGFDVGFAMRRRRIDVVTTSYVHRVKAKPRI